MIDPILEATAEYERTVAPAYELIRRARARLVERIVEASTEALPAAAAWVRMADPTEPDQAQLVIEGIEQPAHPGAAGDGTVPPVAVPGGEAEARAASPIQSADSGAHGRAPAAEPEAGDSPPVASPPANQQPGSAEPPSVPRPARVKRAADSLVECPTCGKELRAIGLGTHRRKAHGYRRGDDQQAAPMPPEAEASDVDPDPEPEPEPREPWVPQPEGVGSPAGMVLHGGKERWLCGRGDCQAFFNTRDARDRHQATHPPIPDVAPAGAGVRRPVVDRALHPGAGIPPSGANGTQGLGQ